MGKLIDLTGQDFGDRIVLQRADRPGPAHWLVRCKCGKEDVVSSQHLRGGQSRSCRNCSRSKIDKTIDMQGQQINSWTVLERAPTPATSTKAFWKVRCMCGREGVVSGTDLRTGHSKSCMSCGSTKYDFRMDLSNRDWCWLLGLFHGDGSTCISNEHGGTLTFACTPLENQSRIIETLSDLVGVNHGVTKDHVNVYSIRLARDFARFKVSGPGTWKMPEVPLHWEEWIAGLLDADAHVPSNGSVVFYQKPHGGFSWLRQALDDLGIHHTTRFRNRETTSEESVYVKAESRRRFWERIHPRFPKKQYNLRHPRT